MKLVTVYHGTSVAFEEEIRENGLPGADTGVRVRLDRDEAMKDAAAWCAAMMVRKQLPPKALLVGATIDEDRVRDVKGTLRVMDGLKPAELKSKQIELPELYRPDVGKAALDHFEAITSRKLAPFKGPRIFKPTA